MAYVQQNDTKDRSRAIVGVALIHAGIGAILVTGLSGVVIETFEPPHLKSKRTYVPLPPPPPEPSPQPQNDAAPKAAPPVYTPPIPRSLGNTDVSITTTILPHDANGPLIRNPGVGRDTGVGHVPLPNVGLLDVEPKVTLAEPVDARPRNDPAQWVTTRDYRSAWINREWTGTTRFSLDIAPSGKVRSCRVTASSGHDALDNATCALVTKRAEFAPARNARKEAVPGRYTSAIQWNLPR